MTYCVGLRLDAGLAFMSDTRTNSGVDNVSRVKKMKVWHKPGERIITLLSSGNLATTQTTVSMLDERSMNPSDRSPSILEEPTMFQVARLVGSTLRDVIAEQSQSVGPEMSNSFGATLILGSQIKGMEPRLFLIYPEGNFIESTADSPFFQVGETKYGRPILLRGLQKDMSFESAVKLLALSFDSTIKANLSVGMPLDLHLYDRDSFEAGYRRRFETDDPYFNSISDGWGDALRSAVETLPDFDL